MPLSKPVKTVVIIVVFTLASTLLFGMCHYMFTRGREGKSDTVEESKRRKAFVARLVPVENPVTITTPNGTITFPVYEAWIESRWSYGDTPLETKPKPITGSYDYQLFISIPEKQWDTITNTKNMGWTWEIQIAPDQYMSSTLGAGTYSLVGYLDRLPGDTLRCQVKKQTSINDPSSLLLDTFTFKVEYEEL